MNNSPNNQLYQINPLSWGWVEDQYWFCDTVIAELQAWNAGSSWKWTAFTSQGSVARGKGLPTAEAAKAEAEQWHKNQLTNLLSPVESQSALPNQKQAE